MKRRPVDFAALIAKDPKKRAVGNASMNARGDIIKKNGKIIKSREQIMIEYNQNHPQTVKSVGIKSVGSEMFISPAEAAAAQRAVQAAAKQQVSNQQQQSRPVVPIINPNPPIAASSKPKQRRLIQD